MTLAVKSQRAIGFADVAVRAHPIGVPAAAGEIPGTAQPIAAVDRVRARGVGRSPGHNRARIGKNRARDLFIEEGCDQGGAIGDEHDPGHGRVVAGDLRDGPAIGNGLDLIATHRARQQHPQQPGAVQLLLHGLGKALLAFNAGGGRRQRGS